jgi:HAE1 family hydrophobic/amphiphilic exporter-1
VDEDGDSHRKDLRDSIAAIDTMLKKYRWPQDMRFEVGGTAEDFMESFQWLGVALIVSILLVYMVMASQFESFRQPFIILFSVPLALIGVVLTFVITGNPLDVSALIGVIMLMGIVVNNGIVMVDAANQLRETGLDRFEAIREAAKIRLRPVLLTSMTTISGMVPLALEIGDGSEAWSGMAQAVIGGLIMSTVLTLVVVPTFYTIFAKKEVAP